MLLICAAAILVTLASCSTSHTNANGREQAGRIDPYQPEDVVSIPQTNFSFPQLTTFAFAATLINLPADLDAGRVNLVKQGLESSLLENLNTNGGEGAALEEYVAVLKSLEEYEKTGWLESILKSHCSKYNPATTSLQVLNAEQKQSMLIKAIMMVLRIRLYADNPQSVLHPMQPPLLSASGEPLIFQTEMDAQIMGSVKPGIAVPIWIESFLISGDLKLLKTLLESLDITHVLMVINQLSDRSLDDILIPAMVKYLIDIIQPSQCDIMKTCLACEIESTLHLLLPMIRDDQAFSSVAFKKLMPAATILDIHRASMIKGIRKEGERVPRLHLGQEERTTLVCLARANDIHPHDFAGHARLRQFIDFIEFW